MKFWHWLKQLFHPQVNWEFTPQDLYFHLEEYYEQVVRPAATQLSKDLSWGVKSLDNPANFRF